MRYFLYQNTFMLSIAIILFINIVPIEMQTITIEIEDLESLITTSLDRLLGAIDPTIDKFQNTTIEILSVFEDRIKINISETFYSLETNLFVLLFAVIVFFIIIFVLLNLLDILLVRYGHLPAERRFVGLIVVTVIFVWLFIAMILSTWPLTNKLDLQTLKYIFVGLLSSVILYFIIIWIYYLYIHRTNLCNYLSLLCGCGTTDRILIKEMLKKTQENIELSNLQF